MATFDTWESYFYPPPDDATMRNVQNIRDPRVLQAFEYGATALRQKQLVADPSLVGEHTYGADHVRAIHRHLFQDVYEWAGEYRTQNMMKQGAVRGFADVRTGEVDRYLADVQRLVNTTEWGRLERDEFASAAANVFAHLNQAHPFREGNGRSSKVFMEHVAMRSKFELDFARVDPNWWNKASEFSRPDLDKYEPVPDSLVPVFQHIAEEREGGPAVTGGAGARQRSPLSASYPMSPTQAAGRHASTRPQEPHRPGQGYGSSGQGIGR
ncbi:Fic family protein [Mumia sp. zg.B21]|uniref:Fic/DOC family protein n=1 Tax=Mumia sp. zg.B21 TaxID=2855447 RepID=UPI001C6EB5B0|nr:Fic family protein [Mumia sp. zg.B21]MBW9211766.1 Fic family protein [Mumia sp. zg.B21]